MFSEAPLKASAESEGASEEDSESEKGDVWSKACEQLNEQIKVPYSPVNLSSQSLCDQKFYSIILFILRVAA